MTAETYQLKSLLHTTHQFFIAVGNFLFYELVLEHRIIVENL